MMRKMVTNFNLTMAFSSYLHFLQFTCNITHATVWLLNNDSVSVFMYLPPVCTCFVILMIPYLKMINNCIESLNCAPRFIKLWNMNRSKISHKLCVKLWRVMLSVILAVFCHMVHLITFVAYGDEISLYPLDVHELQNVCLCLWAHQKA